MNIGQNILVAARNILGINQVYFNESISNKTVIFTNLTTIHLLNNNFHGAQEALKNAFPPDKNPLPPIPLLNLKIYFHLRNGKHTSTRHCFTINVFRSTLSSAPAPKTEESSK